MSDNSDFSDNVDEFEEDWSSSSNQSNEEDEWPYEFNENSEILNSGNSSVEILNDSVPSNGNQIVERERNGASESDSSSSDSFVYCSTNDLAEKETEQLSSIPDDNASIAVVKASSELEFVKSDINALNDTQMNPVVKNTVPVEYSAPPVPSSRTSIFSHPQLSLSGLDLRAFSMFPTAESLSKSTKKKIQEIPESYEESSLCTVSFSSDCYIPQCDYQQSVNTAKEKMKDLTISDSSTQTPPVDLNSMDISNPPPTDPRLNELKYVRLTLIKVFAETKELSILSELLHLNNRITVIQGFNDIQSLPKTTTTTEEAKPCSSKDQCYKKASTESPSTIINAINDMNARYEHEQKSLISGGAEKEKGHECPLTKILNAKTAAQTHQEILEKFLQFSGIENPLIEAAKAKESCREIYALMPEAMKKACAFDICPFGSYFTGGTVEQSTAESIYVDAPTTPMASLTLNDPQPQPSTQSSKCSVVTGPCFNIAPTVPTTSAINLAAAKEAYDEMQEHEKTFDLLKDALNRPTCMPQYLLKHFERRLAEAEGNLKAAQEKYKMACKKVNADPASAISDDAKNENLTAFKELYNEMKRCKDLQATKKKFISYPGHSTEMAQQLDKKCIASDANLHISKQKYNELYVKEQAEKVAKSLIDAVSTNPKVQDANLQSFFADPFQVEPQKKLPSKTTLQLMPLKPLPFRELPPMNSEAHEYAIAENIVLRAEVHDLKQSLQDTENSRRTLAEMNESLTAENKWLLKNDESIREMEMAMKNTKRDHKKAMEEKDAKIAGLQAELQKQKEVIEKQERTITHQFAQIEGLNRKLTRKVKDSSLEDLEKELKEAETRIAELNANKDLNEEDRCRMLLEGAEEIEKLRATIQRKKNALIADEIKVLVEESIASKNAEIAKIKADFEKQIKDLKKQEEGYLEAFNGKDADIAQLLGDLEKLKKSSQVAKKDEVTLSKTAAPGAVETVQQQSVPDTSVFCLPLPGTLSATAAAPPTQYWSSVFCPPLPPLKNYDSSAAIALKAHYNHEIQTLRLEEAQHQKTSDELKKQLKTHFSSKDQIPIYANFEKHQQNSKIRNAMLHQKIEEKNAEIAKMKTDYEKQLQALKEQEEEILNLYQGALDSKDADFALILSENEDLKKQLTQNCRRDVEEIIKSKNDEIAILKADIHQVQKKLTECVNYQSDISQSTVIPAATKTEFQNNNELLILTEELSSITKELNGIQKASESQSKAKADLEKEIADLNEDLSSTIKELADMKKVVDTQNKKKADLEKEMADLKEDLSMALQNVCILHKSCDNKVKADLEKEIGELKDEILKLKESVGEKDAKIVELVVENERLKYPTYVAMATGKKGRLIGKFCGKAEVKLDSKNVAKSGDKNAENGYAQSPPQPTPAQPTPTQSTPTQPTPTQPTPTQPTPTQPAPTQPAPTQPTPTQLSPTQPTIPAPVEQLTSYANSLWENLKEAAAKSNEEFVAEQKSRNKNPHQNYFNILKKVENEQQQISNWINSSTKKAAQIQTQVLEHQKKVAKKITAEDLRKALQQGQALQNSVSNSIKDLSKQQSEYYQKAGVDFEEIQKILKTADQNILKQQSAKIQSRGGKFENFKRVKSNQNKFIIPIGSAKSITNAQIVQLQEKLEQLQTTPKSAPPSAPAPPPPSSKPDAKLADESLSDPKLSTELAKAQEQIEYFQKLAADQAEALKKFELAASLEKQLSEATQKADKALKALRKREAMDSVSRDLVLKRFKEDDDDHSPVV